MFPNIPNNWGGSGVYKPPKLGGWGSEQSNLRALVGVLVPPKLGGWGSEPPHFMCNTDKVLTFLYRMLSVLSFYSAKEALVFTVYNHSMCHCSDPHPPNLGGATHEQKGLVPDENNRNPRATTLYILRVNGVTLSVRRPPCAFLTAAVRWV